MLAPQNSDVQQQSLPIDPTIEKIISTCENVQRCFPDCYLPCCPTKLSGHQFGRSLFQLDDGDSFFQYWALLKA